VPTDAVGTPAPARQGFEGDASAAPLVVRFLNVGQGDGAWITTPDQRTILIDCGPVSFGRRLVGELRAAGVTHVDVLAPSHAHADHMGGCIEVVRQMPVLEFMWTGQTDTSLTWRTFFGEVLQRAIPITRLEAGQVYEWGNGATMTVYNPPSHADGSAINEYDDSGVLVVDYFGSRVMFVGDLHARGEQRILARGGIPSAHILKISEHGSAAGSSTAFLEAVRPRLAILSYGIPNAFDLPDPVVLGRLEATGARILHTADQGTITVTIGGYVVSTER
jgi:beta-lactamase superfamily II metal-dependent hydrolase